MKKIVVTTTIYPPSSAIQKFIQKKDWKLLIVGDLKTPHKIYENLTKIHQNVYYLSPKEQESKYKKLSGMIGWNSIQRRNLGFIEAYKYGADIIASVDDDNIPYSFWGENLYVGKEVFVDIYQPEQTVFDPLSVTKSNYLWHRGFPILLLENRLKVRYLGQKKRKVLVQADLWNGDPDIDAIARLTFHPKVKFNEIQKPYASNRIGPFNSQNTFLSREVFPYYAVLPHIGRFDDIWGSYIVQRFFPNSVVYNTPSVRQERNKQNLLTNLENEIFGYHNTLLFLKNLKRYDKVLPRKTAEFYAEYRNAYS